WYDTRTIDDRTPEYRGSIVSLEAGTTYDVKLTLASGTTTIITATTWTDPEELPIARTVMVPSGGPYTITEGGSPDGYVVYTANPGDRITASTVLADSQNGVSVQASYVIIRGLTVKGGLSGIALQQDVHHVVVDRNDISGWGRDCLAGPGKCGSDPESAVRAGGNQAGAFNHITVQRNKIYMANYTSNLWCEPFSATAEREHPHGIRGVSFPPGSSNNVIRYNEITGDINHLYNDGMGNDNNFSQGGFPDADSDINGNIVTDVADDAIEVEGGNRNVRVWGNYIDKTFIGIGNAGMSVGPIYIFRNVMDRSDRCPRDGDGGYNTTSDPKEFIKTEDARATNTGTGQIASGGFRYVLHNTLLQRPGTTGARNGLFATKQEEGIIKNTMSRNNIFNVIANPYWTASLDNTTFDYDLASLKTNDVPVGSHFLTGLPLYAAGNGDSNGAGGMYQLVSTSPGYDAGEILPNFSDNYTGTGPDMGAHEAGSPKMEFGINAYLPTDGSPTNVPTRGPSPTITPTPSLGDTIAPQVSVNVSPTTVAVGANATVNATASDNVGITRVEFYSNTILRATDTIAPYTQSVTFTTLGTNTVVAKAYDAAGNVTTSAPAGVSVTTVPTVIPTVQPTNSASILLLLPEADTYVRKTQPAKTYGREASMSVGGNFGDVTYLRFNLKPLAGKTVKSAILRLSVRNSSNTLQVVKPVQDTTWSETTMTFANKPALGQSIATFTANVQGVKEIPLPPVAIQKLAQYVQKVSIGIEAAGNDDFALDAKEAPKPATRPVLIIQYQ
ncbi:MAG: Ig-like domain-containing protein, partial [Candidatus Levybacteria bacterium]|nr:Ig-like domain-containing protein [Candidatus Levybacteria bacterium]